MFSIEGEADGLAAQEEKIVQSHKKQANFENPRRGSGGTWVRRAGPISGQTAELCRDVRCERFSA
jgi:hypothetical protein